MEIALVETARRIADGAKPNVEVDLDSPKARQILAGARAVFNERGFEGSSMSEIAARAGVSKGTLYNYFPDKQALFGAHVREMCEREGMPIFKLDADTGDVRGTLLQLASRFLALTTRGEAVATFRIVMSEAPRFPELGRMFLDAGPRRGVGLLAGWLEELDRRGRLRVPDPDIAAWQFIMLCRGPVFYDRVLAQTAGDDTGRATAWIDAAVDTFLRAYGVAAG